MNKDKIQEILTNAYLNYLEGNDEEVEDYDLIYRDNVTKMKNYLKILTLLNEHNKNLLAENVEDMEDDDFEKYNFYNSVFLKFQQEVGPIKDIPYIKAIFARAVLEILKKEKKKVEFWKKWLKEYNKKDKPFTNYNLDTCPCYPTCIEGKLEHVNDFIKKIEYKLLRKYPDISSGRRKVDEQRVYKGEHYNMKTMCLDTNLYTHITEPTEKCLVTYDEPIEIEESETVSLQLVKSAKHADEVEESLSLSSDSTEIEFLLHSESDLCHLIGTNLRLGDISKASM
ncbi:hypothetical protein O3M35_010383 [Rhynocoris fuscipes]